MMSEAVAYPVEDLKMRRYGYSRACLFGEHSPDRSPEHPIVGFCKEPFPEMQGQPRDNLALRDNFSVIAGRFASCLPLCSRDTLPLFILPIHKLGWVS